MGINIIVSVSKNWVIGKDNKLLWKLSSDLRRFKEITNGKPIIMGQNTFESLPNGALQNRTNIVLTQDPNFNHPNILIANSIEESINKAKEIHGENCEIFIIGGGNVYRQFIDIADKIYLTLVHTTIEGDTTFPEIDNSKWQTIRNEFESKSDKNEYDHTYKIYIKRK